MDNLIEYKEGAQPEDNVRDNIDNQLTFGTGRSYGIEFLVKRTKGKLTGWVSYTLAKTDRKFDELNNGLRFPARYDRRHDLSIVASYRLTDRWEFGASFVYGTSSAFTLPNQRYFVNGEVITEFGSRNGYRLKPFHRGDISVTRHGKEFKEKKRSRFR